MYKWKLILFNILAKHLSNYLNLNIKLNYSDAISGLIEDYKKMKKINIHLKDFIKGNNDLVDSIRKKSSGVLLENTCHILDCERPSHFTHDKITDMLVVHSREGLKKAELKFKKIKELLVLVL